MSSIKIVLADDHKLVRQGIRSLLEMHPEIEVIGEAGDGEELLKKISELNPDIVLLDVMMPNWNGIEAAKIVRQGGEQTRLIFLTMYSNSSYVVRALQNGAYGYVLKDADFSEILQAIQNAMDGKRFVSSLIAGEVLEVLLDAGHAKNDVMATLSVREKQIPS